MLKMEYYILLFFFNMISIKAMFDTSDIKIKFSKMSDIEKALVKREIENRGFKSVKEEVDQAKDSKLLLDCEDQQSYHYIPTLKLKIEMVFDREIGQTDPLAQLIFSAIDKIESKAEYKTNIGIPNQYQEFPTNYIGSHDTRYYWVDDNRQQVRIESQLTNRNALNRVLKEYKK